MENRPEFIIYDTEHQKIYTGYHDDCLDPRDSDFVQPTWASWDPHLAFNMSLEDAVSETTTNRCGTNSIESASREFQEIIKGIDNWNSKNPDNKYTDKIEITTLDELKRVNQELTHKTAYLNEIFEDKAIDLFLKYNQYVSNKYIFQCGVKWARIHPE